MARARRDGTGGIRGLVALIESDAGEAIDATLQAEYGLSLGDLFTGRLTLRRLGALLRHLPLDGTALWRHNRRTRPEGVGKAAPPPEDWWTPERDLMAAQVDGLRILAWQQSKAGHEGRDMPQPIRRPGQTTVPRLAPHVAMRRLEQMRAGRDDAGAEVHGG